jgi:membrane fusion protein (multidrug efflux system)
MSQGKWLRYSAIGGLILASLSFFGCKTKSTSASAGPPEVGTVTLSPQRLLLTTELPGRIASYLVAEIRPQVNGIIQRRLFEEGSHVEAGQLLYQIDPAPYQAAYDQAKAALATAEADLLTAEANLPALRSRAERFKGLVAIHAVGQQDYDDAAAALRQAEATISARKAAIEVNRAALETARINFSYTPIKAPISGRIGKSNITVGALATAYQPTPLAVIQQINPVYVDVEQANADLLRLRANLESGRLRRDGTQERKVRLLIENGTPYPFTGTLQFRDVTADPTTGSISVRMVFPNPHEVLLPGVYVRAVVEEGVKEAAILVPQEGVARDLKGSPYSLVVGTDSKVQRRFLELDRAIGDRWLVAKGLNAGDQVIVEGVDRARPGAVVHAAPATSEPTTGQPAQPGKAVQ